MPDRKLATSLPSTGDEEWQAVREPLQTGWLTQGPKVAELSGVLWLRLPKTPKNGQYAWQSFVTFVKLEVAPAQRNVIMERLRQRGISTRPGTHAEHMLGYYATTYGFKPEDYPSARSSDDNSMAIPLHNKMVEEDFRYIVDVLKSI